MNNLTENVETPTAAPPPEAAVRAFLQDWAGRKIRGFEGTIDETGEYLSKIYSTANSISEQIAADYNGRFLIELVQNAHDVHPEQRKDGEIEVLFDAGAGAAPHGVLYVANGGAPFAQRNVEALSDLGLSSKPPGQAIGNKGLGFRSVRHICDAPEIYSQAEGLKGLDRFAGFCFRFANDDDLAALTSGPRVLELARKDLPPFHVPVLLDAQSPQVRSFAERGFATVIALPLRDARAADAVVAEIDALQGLSVPMLLFLSRLARLEVRVVAADGVEAAPLVLTRSETPVPGAPSSLAVADLGPVGRHLIARRAIDEPTMIEAIAAGIEQTQLHSHWAEWTGEGEVALAVRLGGAVALRSRIFTYLPMGEQAHAPFAGYLHASFFPTANRKGLDGKVRLNAMLLERAADLAAEIVAWLANGADHETSGLSPQERARAAVDLLCWRKTQSFETAADLPLRVATGVAAATGVAEFIDAPVAPVLATDGSEGLEVLWRSPRVARRWTYTGETFSVEAAARHAVVVGAWPLWPGLGDRAAALVAFCKARIGSYVEIPTSTERAALAVQVAAALQSARRTPPAAWTTFYKHLAEFVGAGGGALADQLILWGDDGALHPAMSTAAPALDAPRPSRRRVRRTGRVAVFAPPARRGVEGDEANDLSPPSALAENFAFLSERLDWYGELADARTFLVRHRLVLEFDRESILTQLARVLREDTRRQSRAAGLRWAFQIWRRPQGRGRSVSLPANLRLYVPTIGQEFIPAEEAVFSDGWPEETRGRLVQRLLDAAPVDCPDLDDVARRRLAKPDHYGLRVGTSAQWTEFLTELGVKRGLHPVQKPLSGTNRGHVLDGEAFWGALGLSAAAITTWKKAVAAEKPAPLAPASFYSISGDLQWMPGQWDVARFDREALECFALLVFAWLGENLPESWSATIRHSHFSQADVREWPTPLKVFLREAAWVPAQEPTANGAQPVVVKPPQIWMAADSSDRFPPYLRRPAIPVMRALDRASAPHMAAIRKYTGLRTFDQAGSLLQQAAFLADQFAKPGFDGFYERHLANLYAGTWQRIADYYRAAPLPVAGVPVRLLARRSGALETFVLRGAEATNEAIYVRDVDNETAASLVEAAGRPMLEVRAGDKARLGQVLRAFYGDHVRLLSEADYRITVDRREVGTGEMDAVLSWCPRLPLMAAVAMEGLKGFDARNLPLNRQVVLDRLSRVLVQTGARLGFRLDDVSHDELQAGPEALSLKLADGRAVVVVRTDGRTGWSQLDRSLSALCDAIDQPGLEQGLRILLRSLQATGAAMADPVVPGNDLDELCDSLRLTARARRAVRENLGAGLERYVPWLRALVYLGGGQTAIDAFALDEAEAVQDPARLRQAIASWLAPIGCDANMALDACRTALSVAELRDTLGLDFEGLNRALMAVNQLPDTYPDVHARQLANRVKSASMEIGDALRTVFAPTLAAGHPAPAYARARDAANDLAPEPAWAVRWREVPDAVLVQHIDAWLASYGAPPLGVPHPGLSQLEDVRRANGQTLKALVGLAGPLIRAWCAARNTPIPAPWAHTDGGLADLRTSLDQAGVIDFQALNREALLTWIDRIGRWPPGMKLTLDREALELGDAAIAAARAKAEAEVAARRKQERSIEFNGRSRDPEETDWAALDAELTQALSRAFLKTPIGLAAPLAAARARSGDGPGAEGLSRGSRFTSYGGRTFAPSAKTDMIGRLGELAVRRWLQARLPKQDIDEAWKSSNGEPFTGRTGRDGLGYDFEISWQRQTWQIEVKASLNDPRTFELGETEVRAGRVAARARSGLQYWIAYVSNLANPAQAQVEIIPNPLSEAGEAVLELVGEGLRYSFRRP